MLMLKQRLTHSTDIDIAYTFTQAVNIIQSVMRFLFCTLQFMCEPQQSSPSEGRRYTSVMQAPVAKIEVAECDIVAESVMDLLHHGDIRSNSPIYFIAKMILIKKLLHS